MTSHRSNIDDITVDSINKSSCFLSGAPPSDKAGFENEARMAMAVKLFELKRISSGMAAELAGCGRVDFLLGLHRFNVPMIDLEEEGLLSDMENA